MSAIRVSHELVKAAKAEARVMGRSAASQIEHWASVGRAVEVCMSNVEIKALFARAWRAHSDSPKQFAPLSVPHARLDGRQLYRARIREEDPMPRLIERAGKARVLEVKQSDLLDAKLARQLIDYSVQRENILPWKAVSKFSGANIKARFRKVPLES